jgi:hypothetical protein
MSRAFLSITSDNGWIGRIGWWNTFDQHWSIPSPPPPWLDLRIWGKAPVRFPAPGWGPRGSNEQP